MPENETMLELNTGRTIVMGDRGRRYVFECRRITERDWLRYFASIVVTSQQDGRERINVVDVNSPRLLLVDDVLTHARGYKVAGDVDLESLPHWKERLPLAHRQQLGEVLSDVRVSTDANELTIHPENEVVYLDATWTAVELGEGSFQMQRFEGLKHVLKIPTEAQYRRYSAEASRSRVVGGSRTGKTVYMGAQPLLAKLYDELVTSVEGYVFNGQYLADRAQIILEMDTLHKVMAAQEIFQPQNTASLIEEPEEIA